MKTPTSLTSEEELKAHDYISDLLRKRNNHEIDQSDLIDALLAWRDTAVAAARIDEIEKALEPPKKYRVWRGDNCEHDSYLPDRLAALTQQKEDNNE